MASDTNGQKAKGKLDGTKFIIIGAGFGGLASAIELKKRGAEVKVFESYPDMKKQGDVIMIGSNATCIMQHWGSVLDELVSIASQPPVMSIQDKSGKVLLNQNLPAEFGGHPNIYTKRGRAQMLMYEYAVSLGVDISFGTPVTEVFEDDNSAGVVAGPNRYTAGAVIAADGVHSKTRNFITGRAERPKKSGFAVYRSWFPLGNLKNDPVTAPIAESPESLFKIWIAEDTHAILTTNVKLQAATCFVTHKDKSDIKEDWNLPGDKRDMEKCVQGWDPLLIKIIQQIQPECLIDYKLLWRDPVRQWVSAKGRICLVGDAAHPHLATSGTGGAQAIEGGATLGVLLEKLDVKDIPLAFKAYEKLRYERTSLTQRMGWETRHAWHQTDWELVAKNPNALSLPQPAWLNGVDAAKYADERFNEVIAHLQFGAPFISTNIPEGHIHEDWTIEKMLAYEGKKVDENFYQTR
ncbi:FAD binding domain-containing protein [Cladophialophora immunda]|nr:FAD binding domain-containing protein [Cladophialophora immunda]